MSFGWRWVQRGGGGWKMTRNRVQSHLRCLLWKSCCSVLRAALVANAFFFKKLAISFGRKADADDRVQG